MVFCCVLDNLGHLKFTRWIEYVIDQFVLVTNARSNKHSLYCWYRIHRHLNSIYLYHEVAYSKSRSSDILLVRPKGKAYLFQIDRVENSFSFFFSLSYWVHFITEWWGMKKMVSYILFLLYKVISFRSVAHKAKSLKLLSLLFCLILYLMLFLQFCTK